MIKLKKKFEIKKLTKAKEEEEEEEEWASNM
jgi:hypothetical protein